MQEQMIGKVSDFFARPVVAAMELTAALKVGDKIHFKGQHTDFETFERLIKCALELGKLKENKVCTQ